MALFFLVAGLEIKRELTTGELRRARAALLPVVAAVAGMAVPALLYLAIVGGGPGADGWGIPMATDVAFALGVLALAGARVPSRLRPLLLALAIVDDIGSVVVVALFYAGGSVSAWLAVAFGVSGLVVLPRIHVRATLVYVALGVLLWYAMYRAGLHPALAGVVVGLLTPSVPFQRPHAVSAEAHRTADLTEDDPEPPDADAHEWLRLADLSRDAVSPLTARRAPPAAVDAASWCCPLFALANMGVELSAASIAAAAGSVVVWAILGRADRRQGAGHLGRNDGRVPCWARRPPRRRPVRAPGGDGGGRGHGLHGLPVRRRGRVPARSPLLPLGEDRPPRGLRHLRVRLGAVLLRRARRAASAAGA